MKTIIPGHLPIFSGTCEFCNATIIVEPEDVEYDSQLNKGTGNAFIEVKCSTEGCINKVILNKHISSKYLYKEI